MLRVTAGVAQTPSFLFLFYFLGLFSSPLLPPPRLLSYSPTLCSLTPHFLPTLFTPSPPTPLHPTSLFMLALSPSIWWNSAADNACNWSDSHFSSVFGPDKEYCQHFADMASAGRIKWTLFCSVCSKLKASQFICSRLRLTGASYSLKKKKKNTAETRGGCERKRIREISLSPKKRQSFSFCSRPHSAPLLDGDAGRMKGQDR